VKQAILKKLLAGYQTIQLFSNKKISHIQYLPREPLRQFSTTPTVFNHSDSFSNQEVIESCLKGQKS